MCNSKASGFVFHPILWVSTPVCVRGDHLSLQFHSVKVEGVIVAHRAKPYILSAAFPIALGPPPFFSFPCYPVPYNEISRHRPKDCAGGSPISTNVYRRVGLQNCQQFPQPGINPPLILFSSHFLETISPKLLVQVVRGIHKEKVHKGRGQVFQYFL